MTDEIDRTLARADLLDGIASLWGDHVATGIEGTWAHGQVWQTHVAMTINIDGTVKASFANIPQPRSYLKRRKRLKAAWRVLRGEAWVVE